MAILGRRRTTALHQETRRGVGTKSMRFVRRNDWFLTVTGMCCISKLSSALFAEGWFGLFRYFAFADVYAY